MKLPDDAFAGARTILDVGGWFHPEPRATHVVDLMPWETRGARLSLARLPHERFEKATWFQADFLKSELRLPFADKSFDLVVCGHTVEDLSNPRRLLEEMRRVGRRGVIECPSRLTEQTKGIRDRASPLPGHPHHHWIVDSVDGELQLYSKGDSRLLDAGHWLPLSFTEHCIQSGHGYWTVIHPWTNELRFRVITGSECASAARQFAAAREVEPLIRLEDSVLRCLRRVRRRLRGVSAEDDTWWPRMVQLSRPYSAIELPMR